VVVNFNLIPCEIKYFIPGKETVNDIPNLFGSLQKMKIPQVQSDIDLEVVNSYTTDLSGIYNIITVDDKSTDVNVMSQISQEICFVVLMLSLSMFICLMTSLL
jgi:hypothetical protein